MLRFLACCCRFVSLEHLRISLTKHVFFFNKIIPIIRYKFDVFVFCLVCICVYPVAYRRRYADHCVLASSRLLKFKTWLPFVSCFVYSTLIIYLAMKIPCLLFFLQQLVFTFLRRVLFFIIHFCILLYCSPSLSVLSLFDIFDSLSVHFHIHLFHLFCFFYVAGSLVLRQFIIAFVFYLQKYSLTLIIEISRFLMSRFHNLLLLVLHTSLLLFFSINDDRFLAEGELKVLSDETKVTSRKG